MRSVQRQVKRWERSGTQVKKQVGSSAVWTQVKMQVFVEVSLQVVGQVAIPAYAQVRESRQKPSEVSGVGPGAGVERSGEAVGGQLL